VVDQISEPVLPAVMMRRGVVVKSLVLPPAN
jgi:hypothetical protein